MNLCPLLRILFGGDGRVGIGVVGLDVFFEGGRDWLIGVFGETVQEIGVGGVGERVAAGLDDGAGVQVPIEQRVARVVGLARDILFGLGICGQRLRGRRVAVSVGGGSDRGCGAGGWGWSEAREDTAERGGRHDNAVYVLVLGFGSRALYG